VIVTTPASVAAQVCSQLAADERERLRAIEYVGILCASLVLKKPLAGYYVTNVTDPAPFTGVIEMTALVDRAEFDGKTLVGWKAIYMTYWSVENGAITGKITEKHQLRAITLYT
jgi:protoporphyrinogen oxidase